MGIHVITSDEIKKRLWDGADELRGSMNASQYMDYMLGLMFYKFLSDKTLEQVRATEMLHDLTEAELLERYESLYKEYQEKYIELIRQPLGYYIPPEYLYQRWMRDINEGRFELQIVTDSLNNFERMIASNQNPDDFENLFSSLDLTNQALGKDLNARSKNIKSLIALFADLNMVALQKSDVLGDAYEYLIGMFAIESGKKAGEFYTPREVSEVLAQVVASSGPIASIYDPAVGSGSLLLTVKQHLSQQAQKELMYYGQEKNTATYNLTRMNLLLHGVRPEKMTVRNADTLAQDWPEDPERPNEACQFDAIVMNPPYSLKNWNREGLTVSDPRFSFVGSMPPDSVGDYAFLLHGLYHLGQQGTMAIVLPHGVLFRGDAEGAIRRRLIEKNYIDAVIGLPGKLFTNTDIPVCIVVLKKNRQLGNGILIIDASQYYIKVKKGKKGKIQNILQEKDIARIIETYTGCIEIKNYSHLATLEEIKKNDYNLNIPRYVEPIETEIPHHVDGHLYGGIPKEDLNRLPIIMSIAQDIVKNHLIEVREGFYKVEAIDSLQAQVLQSSHIENERKILETHINTFIEKYWTILKSVTSETNLADLKAVMLDDAKNLFADIPWVDSYEAYQVVAELWHQKLTTDLEIIAGNDFYDAAIMTEPHMVTKGSGKTERIEQDGVIGRLIPNDFIEHFLFSEKRDKLDSYQSNLDSLEAELGELIESAKEEASAEYYALNDLLKRDDDDEVKDAFDAALVNKTFKKLTKTDEVFELVKKTYDLLERIKKLKKSIKDGRKSLDEKVYAQFEMLTHEEIDHLMWNKWFGNFMNDIGKILAAPILKELDILIMLNERYSDTLQSIDLEIDNLEKSLEDMMKELVLE